MYDTLSLLREIFEQEIPKQLRIKQNCKANELVSAWPCVQYTDHSVVDIELNLPQMQAELTETESAECA